MNNDSSDNGPKMDNSHVSSHFMKGTYQNPITQKGHYQGYTFQTYTNVDNNGNVTDSGFGNFNKEKK